jgi:nicotinamide-nucleotide amidase
MFAEKTVKELVQVLGEKLTNAGLVATTAESCTGGGVAYAITAVSGSSAWFDRSFVTYTNEAKQQMLGVAACTLEKYGAVSEAVVREMTAGTLTHSHANIAVAISGIAGPTGGSDEKPVGTVWIAWQTSEGTSQAECYLFQGDREEVRLQAIREALVGLLAFSK